MSPEFLETAVKLAGLGAGGACIASLAGSVYLLSKAGPTKSAHDRRVIQWFMAMCLVMTIVLSISGVITSRIPLGRLNTLETEFVKLQQDNDRLVAISQVKEQNLTLYRARQNEYIKNFNETIGGLKAVAGVLGTLGLTKYTKYLNDFLDATTPHEIIEIPVSKYADNEPAKLK